jgi:hypothetical protein
MSRLVFFIWLVLSLGWVLAVGSFALQGWPHMPLDISHTDPATRAAFDEAVLVHVGKHAAVALLPPLVMFVLARLVSR